MNTGHKGRKWEWKRAAEECLQARVVQIKRRKGALSQDGVRKREREGRLR